MNDTHKRRYAARTLASAAALLAATTAAAQTGAVPVLAGRYLAANCANCHGTHGKSAGSMPSLAGLQRAYLIEQMRLFRDGKRDATIMQQLAKGYSDEQIEAVAEHFARQQSAR